jgi:hypothetical protein
LNLSGFATPFTDIPGLTQTVTVPSGAKVIVSTDGGVQGTAGGPPIIVDVALFVDGVQVANGFYTRIFTDASATNLRYWSRSGVVSVAPGTHTFTVRADMVIDAAAAVSDGSGTIRQGQLTVTLLNS